MNKEGSSPIGGIVGASTVAIIGIVLFCAVLAPLIVGVLGDAGRLGPMVMLIGTVVAVGVILAVYAQIRPSGR